MAATATEETVMAEELVPIAQNLRGIRNKLKILKEEAKFTFEEIHHYQQMLDAIDSKRQDGVFVGSAPEKIPVGQATCVEILEESYDLVADMLPQASDMNNEMTQAYKTLAGIRKKLLQFKAHRSYTADDIHQYQNMVDAIDSKRVDGIFFGSLQAIPAGQAQLSAILHQDYDLLHDLLSKAREMNSEMRAICAQLISIRRKMVDMQIRHVKHTTEDIHIFQMQLDAIDRDRVEGVFAGSPRTVVPHGQAVCTSLLEKCYKLVHQLQGTATDVGA